MDLKGKRSDQADKLKEVVGSLGLGKGQLREAFKSFIDELEPKARVLIRWHPAKGPFPYGLLNGKIILECFKRNCKDAHQILENMFTLEEYRDYRLEHRQPYIDSKMEKICLNLIFMAR